MSDTSQELTRRHLVRMMECDLVHDSAAIVQRRNEFLGIDQAPSAGPESHDYSAVQESRARATQMLDMIRSRFWDYSSAELIAAIAQIDLVALPDLKFSVARLSYVAERRDELQEIEAHDSCVPEVLSGIKRVFLMSPSSAISERKWIASKFDSKVVSGARKMLKMMKSKHEGLYSLERDWLDQILIQGNKQNSEKRTYVAIVIGILVLIMAALVSQ